MFILESLIITLSDTLNIKLMNIYHLTLVLLVVVTVAFLKTQLPPYVNIVILRCTRQL